MVGFAENLADENSGDACRHFATFMANAMVEKFERDNEVFGAKTLDKRAISKKHSVYWCKACIGVNFMS